MRDRVSGATRSTDCACEGVPASSDAAAIATNDQERRIVMLSPNGLKTAHRM
ncbi:hypothetical protein RSO01_59580 [Reyranella soli]|uniref:Uncharacterized protein n=1 Tax=Reyranella soli TaxID=1230389 RepID=A0A512NIP9_9HYPH|nr:hypothetical protein RSO01_59580 [Reyranella soli]